MSTLPLEQVVPWGVSRAIHSFGPTRTLVTNLITAKFNNGDYDHLLNGTTPPVVDGGSPWSLSSLEFSSDFHSIRLTATKPGFLGSTETASFYVNIDGIGLKTAYFTPEGEQALIAAVESVIGVGTPWGYDLESGTVGYSGANN